MEESVAKKFSEFLNQKYIEWKEMEWRKSKNRNTSQNEFAKWLGMSPTTISPYMTGVRPPSEANADALADKLGTQVYEILGKSARMPRDPLLRSIANTWHALDENEKRQVAEAVKHLASKNGNGDKESNPTPVKSAT